ncbi:MAG: thermopsin family protease [Thermoproteus sp. AZ2]|uniref:Thermopsin family protease n=1 Tax=Thermoproteus sp. AZ2 TaxID=1609232 RepID=A0ACC6V017_9CREN
MFLRGLLPLILALSAALASGLTVYGNQCVGVVFNMSSAGLGPGYYLTSTINFSSPGLVQIYALADITANEPVEALLATSNLTALASIGPSPSLKGPLNASVGAPGSYALAVYNPKSNAQAADIRGVIYAELCGGPAVESWLSRYLRLYPAVVGGEALALAPVGIASYGVVEVNGTYYAYSLKTSAALGVVYVSPSTTVADYYQNGAYYGDAFSIQLNAYIVVELKSGARQYYWVQDVLSVSGGEARVLDAVWNQTSYPSWLRDVEGNGSIFFSSSSGYWYGYAGPWTRRAGTFELEIKAGASGGAAVVEFYVNGEKFDEVVIRPYAKVRAAYIEIAPLTLARGVPLDLELVVAGQFGEAPYAVLQSGQIGLGLYVYVNGSWAPPLSAWPIGASTYEAAYASAEPTGIGSVVVAPGPPTAAELWAGTVVVAPWAVYITSLRNASAYLSPLVYFNNSTRLALSAVYVDGRRASPSDLSSAPLGSLVVGEYVKQYYISITTPYNSTRGWLDAGSAISVPPIYFGNGTRLIGNASSIIINRPLNITIFYIKQYLVNISSIFGGKAVWINAGALLKPNATALAAGGVRFTPTALVVNGVLEPIGSVEVEGPLSIRVVYDAVADVNSSWLGLPALFASAYMACGGKSAGASTWLSASIELSIYDPPTAQCRVKAYEVPLIPVVAAALLLTALWGKRRQRGLGGV